MKNWNENLPALIPLYQLPLNRKILIELDQNQEWVKDLLLELNEGATYLRPQELLKVTSLKLKGEMEKKHKSDLGEVVLIRLEVEGHYAADCVKSLRPLKKELSLSIKACVIDALNSDTQGYKDGDETFLENDVYQVYFYEKNSLNIQEVVHEQIFLHHDPYPIHEDLLESE